MFDLKNCKICPRECGRDRTKTTGFCGASDKVRVSKIMLHRWEEPCISGRDDNGGSGAIFFSGCPLKCVFCQNKAISRCETGEILSISALAEKIKYLEKTANAYNINFVSPTQYIPHIIEALSIYRPRIPLVYNTGGYEKKGTISALEGYSDIFLTDFKYGDNETAKRFSASDDYVDYAVEALKKMFDITGKPRYDERGMMQKGVIVRHLVLPGCRHDSVKALERVASAVPPSDVVLSLMSQYTPEFAPDEIKQLKRRITTFEYEYVRDAAMEMGFDGYSQDISSATSKYTPEF